jgi:hypothetical protein
LELVFRRYLTTAFPELITTMTRISQRMLNPTFSLIVSINALNDRSGFKVLSSQTLAPPLPGGLPFRLWHRVKMVAIAEIRQFHAM